MLKIILWLHANMCVPDISKREARYRPDSRTELKRKQVSLSTIHCCQRSQRPGRWVQFQLFMETIRTIRTQMDVKHFGNRRHVSQRLNWLAAFCTCYEGRWSPTVVMKMNESRSFKSQRENCQHCGWSKQRIRWLPTSSFYNHGNGRPPANYSQQSPLLKRRKAVEIGPWFFFKN